MAGPPLRRARSAFLSPLPLRRAPAATSSATCRRRHAAPRCAKIQPAGESSVPAGAGEENPVSGLRPPPGATPDPAARPRPGALPTLSSLSGMGVAEVGEAEPEPEPQVMMQGAGLSVAEENDLKAFLLAVFEEFKVIEWPTVNRVLKVTVIVIATMIVASAGIYTIDGFFLSISKRIFEQ